MGQSQNYSSRVVDAIVTIKLASWCYLLAEVLFWSQKSLTCPKKLSSCD